MKKSIFGLVLIAMLIGVGAINVFQEVRKNKAVAVKQEENISQIAKNEGSLDPNSVGLSQGDTPPDFELKTLEGKTIRLSDYNGKKVILNFWASWCPPCKAEMPHMENYYKTKAKKQNVEIIAVNLTNVERGSNKIEQVEGFVNEYGLTFQIPLDVNGEVGRTYQILSIPTTYMIDSNGGINKKIIGPMDEEMIEKLVKDMD